MHKALRVVPANAYGGTFPERRLESCSSVFRFVPVGDGGLMLVIYLFFIDIFLIDIHVPDVPASQWPHTHLHKTRGAPPRTWFNTHDVFHDLLPFRNNQQLSERFSITDRTLRVSMNVCVVLSGKARCS